MPDRLSFPTVTLESFSRKTTGGVAKFVGSVTSAVAKAMEWTDIPECATSAAMAGELAAHLVQITPKDKELERHAVDLDCSKVTGFELVRREIEGKRGKGYRQELHFKVHFVDPKGARKLEEYLLTCGKSTLIVSYTKQPQQAELPDTTDDAQGELAVQ